MDKQTPQQTGQPSGDGVAETNLADEKQRFRESAHDAGQHLKEDARQAREMAHQRKVELSEKVRQTRRAAASRASQASAQAREKAISQVKQRQQQVGQTCNDVAEAFDSATQTLRDREDEHLAMVTDTASTYIKSGAGYLTDNEPQQLLEDARAMTRRYPELVFGGMFLVGLAAARFLKSSEQRGGYDDDDAADAEPYARPQRPAEPSSIYPEPGPFQTSNGSAAPTPQPEHKFSEVE